MFDTTQHIACRGPFLVAKEVLPAMRKKGAGSFFFSNNSSSLRGKKRMTGQSLYYPRVMMRTLAQVLTEEYSEHGVHVANVVIDGTIAPPGTRALPRNQNRRDHIINPAKIAEAFYYLHTQDPSCWTHELQLTPFPTKPSYSARRTIRKTKRRATMASRVPMVSLERARELGDAMGMPARRTQSEAFRVVANNPGVARVA